ncbi:MAG TPA: thiosulfate oxidation carrier protein SoxY [Burkholderiales bacterium]|jgi:sulfur-oxidizing protein SoxY|nr:thiosulfate oxidation carrier protein SoxY [Burkholderiales bacterium]
MIDEKRRLLLKCTLATGAAGLAAGAGLISAPAFAATKPAQWPDDAFKQKNIDAATQALYGQTAVKSDKIEMNVPTIAENGAVVPVAVKTSLPDVTSIALMIEGNPYALAASFNIPQGTLPYVSNRFKMRKTSDVIALVMSGGKLYSTTKNVKVTIGGCGG